MQRDHPSRHTPPLLLRPQWDLPPGNCQPGWRDKPQTKTCREGLLTAGKSLSKIFKGEVKGEEASQLYWKIELNLVARGESKGCLLLPST